MACLSNCVMTEGFPPQHWYYRQGSVLLLASGRYPHVEVTFLLRPFTHCLLRHEFVPRSEKIQDFRISGSEEATDALCMPKECLPVPARWDQRPGAEKE